MAGINVQPDELVYVEGVVKDRPMAHKIVERRIGKDTWNYTLCGNKMCFSMKNVVMPAKHAIKFAQGCMNCKE